MSDLQRIWKIAKIHIKWEPQAFLEKMGRSGDFAPAFLPGDYWLEHREVRGREMPRPAGMTHADMVPGCGLAFPAPRAPNRPAACISDVCLGPEVTGVGDPGVSSY